MPHKVITHKNGWNYYLNTDALRSWNDHIAFTLLLREKETKAISAYMSLIADSIKIAKLAVDNAAHLAYVHCAMKFRKSVSERARRGGGKRSSLCGDVCRAVGDRGRLSPTYQEAWQCSR